VHPATRPGRLARLAPIALVAIAALAVAACTGGTSSGSTGIKITDPWARTSPMVSGAGAAYMVIENTGSAADAVTGGSSDIATAVEVHETVVMGTAAPMESPAMGGDMASPAASDGGMATGGGMMGMQKVDRLEIPAGGSVELKPGGYHVMLIGLTRELKAGEEITVTLNFEKAGDVTVKIPVREQ
jgi:periplasmic copper chaperone A